MLRQPSKPSTPAPPAAQTDEEKKAERLAKLEAWKQKQAAERERKQKEQAAAGGARSILAELDKKAGLVPSEPVSEAAESPPAPYPGKFDPKAIASKATEVPAKPSLLGQDAAVPSIPKLSATSTQSAAKTEANKKSASTSTSSGKSFFNPPDHGAFYSSSRY
jgi:ATP-dependent RNA helicase DDX46/PRP5